MKSMKKRPIIIIVTIALVMLVYAIVDYINVLSLIGINIKNINVELLDVISNIGIVAILYVISFYYIDNKQNEKDDNAKDTVKVLIKKTFQECVDNLDLLDDKELIEEYIIPKIDGNKTDSENRITHNLQTLPFESFESVIEFASNGYVEKAVFEDYLDIKKEYQSLVSMKITFFDLKNPKTSDQRAMYYNIHLREPILIEKIEKHLD